MELFDWIFWIILIALVMVFWYVPQWLNRRRQQHRTETLAVGDRVLTIGGFIGTLTHLDTHIARVQLAEGVEVTLAAGAIAGQYQEEPTPDVAAEEVG